MTRTKTPPAQAPAILAGVELPEGVYPTGLLQAGFVNVRMLLNTNRMGVFDGPPGTGKTTAARICAEYAGRPVINIQMSHRPSPLEILRLLLRDLTGVMGNGTKSEMEEELRYLLSDWHGLLIIDEVQNLGAAGIQEVRYLHEVSGMGFALLFVGWDAVNTMKKYPDMESRLFVRVDFAPLTGEELLQTVRGLHPTLADTAVEVIRHINDIACKGNLRLWDQFRAALDALRVPGPLTVAAADMVVELIRLGGPEAAS